MKKHEIKINLLDDELKELQIMAMQNNVKIEDILQQGINYIINNGYSNINDLAAIWKNRKINGSEVEPLEYQRRVREGEQIWDE